MTEYKKQAAKQAPGTIHSNKFSLLELAILVIINSEKIEEVVP